MLESIIEAVLAPIQERYKVFDVDKSYGGHCLRLFHVRGIRGNYDNQLLCSVSFFESYVELFNWSLQANLHATSDVKATAKIEYYDPMLCEKALEHVCKI